MKAMLKIGEVPCSADPACPRAVPQQQVREPQIGKCIAASIIQLSYICPPYCPSCNPQQRARTPQVGERVVRQRQLCQRGAPRQQVCLWCGEPVVRQHHRVQLRQADQACSQPPPPRSGYSARASGMPYNRQ